MNDQTLNIQLIPLKDLTLLEDNPRTIDKDQFKKLIKSLQDDPEFLKCRPILVNRICKYDSLENESDIVERKDTLTVYAGNQRVLAAKKLKWKNIWCIVEDDLSEDIMKSRLIKDNAHYGEFHWDTLANSFEIDVLLDAGLTADELVGAVQNITMPDDESAGNSGQPEKCPTCGQKIKKKPSVDTE